jgi:hypothetical protein
LIRAKQELGILIIPLYIAGGECKLEERKPFIDDFVVESYQ